ncbi:MAG TPA: NADH-quinone oxidoreductase subunit C [Armatimonadota bacterium]|jgi:Ni,Fe-hydrogenase III large subunit/Ni,Fe-hydrogenase III component G
MTLNLPTGSRYQQTETTPEAMAETVRSQLKKPGWRLGHLTARVLANGRLALEALLLDTATGSGVICSAALPDGVREYPSMTALVPAAHWMERAAGEMFGLRAVGHPRWKTLRLHAPVWVPDLAPLESGASGTPIPCEPYAFMKVKGEGIHEIPVGPIHAGIIEPGHFRFSCMGEIITNLEIRLGYQHRGLERRLAEAPLAQTRFLAESASTDTAAGNALAHAVAVEQMLGVTPPPRAEALRTIALEIERLANHIGDLGALAGDIGYNIGPTLFPPMRGAALALAQTLTGNRRQRWYIVPGGVARDIDDARRGEMIEGLNALHKQVRRHVPLILENPGVLDRMEGCGRLSSALAKDFGMVGPAGRASGGRYDARAAFPHGIYPAGAPVAARYTEGDVLARARVRADEIESSIAIIRALLDDLPVSPARVEIAGVLPPNAAGIGVVEAWRGELIHWITTDETGRIARYAIKDPSLNNWTGLAIAVRGNLIGDFPVCNKSFNLSYCGNDL